LTATRNKRILSVQPVCDGGGSEHALVRMLRQLSADGWECHVAVPASARLAEEYASAGAVLHEVPMVRLTTSGGSARWVAFAATWPLSVFRLVRLIRRTGVSVVHTNSLHSWVGWAAAALTRRPHVWHAREIVFQSAVALRVERFLAQHFADLVIAVSNAVAVQLDPGNVVVVSDEADPLVFGPQRAGSFRRAVGIFDSVALAGSVARLDTWKGFETLLDAFELVRSRRPDAELVIAGAAVPGKESYAASLEARAAAMAGVHWVGHRRDVADLMADLDVFVAVSTEPEPFGLVVVEALACGVPVVAGAAGGPLEILEADAATGSTGAGRLVRPGDAEDVAAALLELLPAASSTEGRRERRPLRRPQEGCFAAVFARVLEVGRFSV
jgi:glycosyltransferase involved in cell wall biosynthesis